MEYGSLQIGGKHIFLEPEELLKAAVDYFEWAEAHPLKEDQIFQYKGEIVRAKKSKVRVFTKAGLATHLGIPVKRLDQYKDRSDERWAEVIELIEQVIYQQKFENAAASLLNASIIARDLGLADKTENDMTSSDGSMSLPSTINLVAAKNRKDEEEQPDTLDSDAGE